MSSLRNSYGNISNTAKNPFNFYLTDNGSQNGSKDSAVDGSVSHVDFYFEAFAPLDFTINKIGCILSDAGNSSFESYGSLAGPLPSGLQFFVRLGGVENTFDTLIKRSLDYKALGSDSSFIELSGPDRVTTYSFSLLEFSEGLTLKGESGDRFGIRINDNFSALDVHECFINGYSVLSSV